MPNPHHDLREHVALADALDRVLGKGAVIAGEVVIAVADVDLIRLELQLALGSIEALAPVAREAMEGGDGVVRR